MPPSLPTRALLFALRAHEGQKRKYTGEAFIEHPIMVADAVSRVTNDPEILAAAYLHDVVEKTSCTIEQVQEEFGPRVASLVTELTNVYTEQNYPEMPETERKQAERARLRTISADAKIVKLADVTANIIDITEQNAAEAPDLISAKEGIMRAVEDGHPQLRAAAHEALDAARRAVGRPMAVETSGVS
jgi:(p)ppGpp synthase/HD superfamily hydrolase